jgi:hypothetical protein
MDSKGYDLENIDKWLSGTVKAGDQKDDTKAWVINFDEIKFD